MGAIRYIIQLFVKKFHIFMQKKRENLKNYKTKGETYEKLT